VVGLWLETMSLKRPLCVWSWSALGVRYSEEKPNSDIFLRSFRPAEVKTLADVTVVLRSSLASSIVLTALLTFRVKFGFDLPFSTTPSERQS